MSLDIPGNVRTDQANTYTTGAQSLASATSLIVPIAAGSAPTADGDLRYDSTQDAFSAGGAGAINGLVPRIVYQSHSTTDTLTASVITTTETAFAQKLNVPANYLVSNKALRCTFGLQYTTGSAAPTIIYNVRWGGIGGTQVLTLAAITLSNAQTSKSTGFTVILQGASAVGGSASLIANIYGGVANSIGVPTNQVAQPVTVATNAAVDLVLTLTYSGAGVGVTTVTLNSIYIEELTGQP